MDLAKDSLQSHCYKQLRSYAGPHDPEAPICAAPRYNSGMIATLKVVPLIAHVNTSL
jgi:hypothetical protein